MRKNLSSTRGFTLIELIIVITIIAILGAIIFFGVGGTINRSKASVDAQNAAIIMSSIQRGIAENKITTVTASAEDVIASTNTTFALTNTGGGAALISLGYISSIPKVEGVTGQWVVKTDASRAWSVGIRTATQDYMLMPKPASYSTAPYSEL